MVHKRNLSLSFLLAVCCVLSIQAQQLPISVIPVDPSIRVGKLDNGLTYYIRHNALPEKRAFFYIAQKVGAIQEEPQQRGLAHFLEHMCFNGTKHFPGNSMIHYLETIGVKFGENLNAYTAVDETVYNIDNVPTTATGAIDSCLLILHDWSNDLTLDPKEIDKERGVINEEWRMRNSARQRLQEAMMPIILAGSKYADSMPIGTMDVVMHFKPQVLRDYYEKWYRPDLQGVVVVGDINVDEVEAKIKSIFADIPAQPNGAARLDYPVPDNEAPIVFIGKDKETTGVGATVYFKHDAVPDKMKNSIQYLAQDYISDMVNMMLNARYEEMMQKPNPPFTGAGVGYGTFFVAKTKDAFTASVGCKESDIEGGFKAMLREVYRAKEFGFTQGEYDRMRINFLRQLESAYNERDKQKSSSYVNACVRNFLDHAPMASIEQSYRLYNAIASQISLSAVNTMMNKMVTDHNIVIALTAPDKAGLTIPTKEKLLSIMDDVRTEKLAAYVDKMTNEPLLATQPKAGKILSTKKNLVMGTTEMTLSNGVKVVIKKTDFKKDAISMQAVSKGGTSLFSDNDIIDIKNIGVATVGGLGKFSTIDLQKALSGKMASAQASISLTTEGVSAGCSPKDLETMMQLVYLTFTSPRKDMNAFDSYKIQLKSQLKNQAMNPNSAYQDSITKCIYGNLPRTMRMKEYMVDKINYDKILEMYKERFKDAGDFTFFFVGNVDEAILKPYLEKYIASLPSSGKKEDSKKMMFVRPGVITNEFDKQQETPKSQVFMMLTGDEKQTQRNSMMSDMLGQLLDIVYTKTIREDAGAAYSVNCQCGLNSYPKQQAMLEISFSTAPEKKNLAMKLVAEGLQNMIKNGPDAKDLEKVVEYKLKKHAEMVKENAYWMSILTQQWLLGVDFSVNYDSVLKNITAKDIQNFAADLYKQNNRITVTMTSPK
ncbi:MAG: insulinase family protein [Bacteroidales bacterium]|nr:insulinase family protein [Bacteroidales bacterium]